MQMRDRIYKTYDGIKAESQKQQHEGLGNVPEFQEYNLLVSAPSSVTAECWRATKGVTPTAEASPVSSQKTHLDSARSSLLSPPVPLESRHSHVGVLRHISSSSNLTVASRQASPAPHHRNASASPSPYQRNASATPAQHQRHTSAVPEQAGTAAPTRVALLPQTSGSRLEPTAGHTRRSGFIAMPGTVSAAHARAQHQRNTSASPSPHQHNASAMPAQRQHHTSTVPEKVDTATSRTRRSNLAAAASMYGLQHPAELPLAAPGAVF